MLVYRLRQAQTQPERSGARSPGEWKSWETERWGSGLATPFCTAGLTTLTAFVDVAPLLASSGRHLRACKTLIAATRR